MDKTTLRRQWLAQRRSLSVQDWTQRSEQICRQLQQLPHYRQAQTVLTYSSYRQEPDLQGLLGDRSKIWGLPRCVDRQLVWHRFDPAFDCLQPGAFGILEPAATAPRLLVEQVDLILLPCVGADQRGYRLGYGGGFYDRLLADPLWGQIPTIGIVFESMLVDMLPVDDWDRPLNQLCTEMGCYGASSVNAADKAL